jgi:hypothetical protein
MMVQRKRRVNFLASLRFSMRLPRSRESYLIFSTGTLKPIWERCVMATYPIHRVNGMIEKENLTTFIVAASASFPTVLSTIHADLA